VKKNRLKLIKILKKMTGSVWFYKLETEKTEPKLNQKYLKKPSQTGLNRFFPKMTEPNRNRSV
jgi:hypothetical protein